MRSSLVLTLAAALVLAAGCADAGSDATPAARPPGSAAPSGVVRTLAIGVRGRTVTPAPAQVTLEPGQTLRLVVTSDHDDEVHAHGFDVERPLVAGRPTTLDLRDAPPGRYEVETHEPALSLLVVLVP